MTCVTPPGVSFNDDFRYWDSLLTVPLLLMEIVFAMKMPETEAPNKHWTWGVQAQTQDMESSPPGMQWLIEAGKQMEDESTLFLWMRAPASAPNYRTALIIPGMVAHCTAYHSLRIFNSWVEAYIEF